MRIAVVGGGVVGLTASLLATLSGHEVVLVEPLPRDRSAASYSNAGVLHQVQPPPGRLRRRLAPRAAQIMARIAGRLSVEIVEAPLIIAYTGRVPGLPLLARLALRILQPEVRVRMEQARTLRQVEPLLSRNVREGLLVEGYRVVDPRQFMDALWEEVAGRVELVEAKATRINCQGGVEVELDSGGKVGVDAAINAAGPGAERLARQHGVKVETRLVLGVMEVYSKPRPHAIVARLPSRLRAQSKGGAIIPWPGSRTLYGPSFHPDNREPPEGWVARLYTGLLEEEPRGLVERIRGYRTMARPRDFHIIKPSRCPQTVHLVGIESPGFTAAPLLAWQALSSIGIVEGSMPKL